MARADLLCDLIKKGLSGDYVNFRKVTEAISAEERSKKHEVLAKKIDEILQTHIYNSRSLKDKNITPYRNGNTDINLLRNVNSILNLKK